MELLGILGCVRFEVLENQVSNICLIMPELGYQDFQRLTVQAGFAI